MGVNRNTIVRSQIIELMYLIGVQTVTTLAFQRSGEASKAHTVKQPSQPVKHTRRCRARHSERKCCTRSGKIKASEAQNCRKFIHCSRKQSSDPSNEQIRVVLRRMILSDVCSGTVMLECAATW
eukprot:249105-Rhodomonas_salina.2